MLQLMLRDFSIHHFFILLSFILMGCGSNKQNSSSNKIDIGSASIEDYFELDDVTNKVSFLPLEFDSAILLGNVQYMNIVDSTLVLFDNRLHQILFYTLKGDLIKVVKGGREGPSELNFLETFAVDRDNKEVVVFDSRLFKFMRFTLTGEFISETKVDYFARDIIKYGDFWVINNAWSGPDRENPDQIMIANKAFKIVSSFRPQNNKFISTFANPSPFFTVDDKLWYKELLCDTVFEMDIQNQKLIPRLTIDFGNYSIPYKLRNVPSIRIFHADMSKGDFMGLVLQMMTNEEQTLFQFFDSVGKDRMKAVVGLFADDKLRTFSSFSYKGMKIPYPRFSYEGKFYSIVSSEEILEMANDNGESALPETIASWFKNGVSRNSDFLVSFRP